MIEPGRKFVQSAKKYRYSINGQEKETELNENITTAEYWMYDSRLGRRWNVDPVIKEYESPYAAFGNNPIWNIDPDGSDTLKSLNNDQALDAMKIASKTLKTALDKKQKIVTATTAKNASTLTKDIKGSLLDAADTYAQKNNLSLGEDGEFNNLVQEYAEALRHGYQGGGSGVLDEIAKYLDLSGNSKTASTVVLKNINSRINRAEEDYMKKYDATRTIFVQLTSLSLSYGSTGIGAGPKGVNATSTSALRPAYEAEVKDIKNWVNAMRGKSTSEEIARAVHLRRRVLGVKYKDLTPPKKLDAIYKRNMERYGDKLGPSIEWLRNKGKSWDDIIESASRPGGKDINFNE